MRAGGTASTAVAGIVATSLTVRALTLEDFGTLAIAMSVFSILLGVGTLGIVPGSTQIAAARGGTRGARPDNVGLSLVIVVWLTAATLVTTPAVLLAASQPWAVAAPLSLAMAAMIFGAGSASVTTGVARGQGRLYLMEVPALSLSMGRLTAIALVFVLGIASLATLSLALVLAGCIVAAISLTILKRLEGKLHLRLGSRSLIAQVRRFAPFALLSLTTVVIARSGILLLAMVESEEIVGKMEGSLRIAEQAAVIAPQLIAPLFLADASHLVALDARENLRILYRTASKASFGLGLGPALALIAFPDTFLGFLYGRDFPVDRPLVWMIVAGFSINAAFGPNISALMATGDAPVLTKTGKRALVSTLAISVASVIVFGVPGVAVAVLLGFALRNLIVGVALFKTMSLHPFDGPSTKGLLLGVIAAIVGAAVGQAITDPGLVEAVAVTVGLWCAWLGSCVALSVFHRGELKDLLLPSRRRVS